MAHRTRRYCGGVFAAPATKSGRAACHRECKRLAILEIRRRNSRDRWERTPDDRKQAGLERAHRHEVEHQARSLVTAAAHYRLWTKGEDAALLADVPPDDVLAEELSRTLSPIVARRKVLRRRASG